jgi:cytochrome c553
MWHGPGYACAVKAWISRCLPFVLFGAAMAHAQPVPDTIEQRLTPCAACHGKRGEGVRANEYYPGIAGKPAGYLFNQLRNFRERRRQSAVMNYIVAFLSDEYLREIAEYYAAMPGAIYPPVTASESEVLARGESLVKQGDKSRRIPACSACHGENLTGMNPAIPGLVGLDPQYIAAQMGSWRNRLRRTREPDCMANIASLLVPGDISAITTWIATQRARPGATPLAAGALKLPMECGGLDAK